jgi:hypothetical protein
MRLVLWVSLLCVLTAGCGFFTPKETRYLLSAKNHATQDEVRRELGQPVAFKVTSGGDSVWVYHIRDLQPGNYLTAPGQWCDEYALVFDHQGVLRDWVHRSYFHGGEVMPTFCVPDGISAAP